MLEDISDDDINIDILVDILDNDKISYIKSKILTDERFISHVKVDPTIFTVSKLYIDDMIKIIIKYFNITLLLLSQHIRECIPPILNNNQLSKIVSGIEICINNYCTIDEITLLDVTIVIATRLLYKYIY